jgi:hypothetical protein
MDRIADAAAHMTVMLRLNPNDNQGIRYELAGCLLALGAEEVASLDALDELLGQYDESSATWQYAKAIAAFAREGDSTRARRALTAARRENPHLPQVLAVEGPLAPQPDCYSPGTPEEAQYLADIFAPAFARMEGALVWVLERSLKSGSHGRKRMRLMRGK